MKKWVRLAARFYPSSWRHRYGAEFDALLADTHSGWRDVADVFFGAMMMQMSMWSYRNMAVGCGLAGMVLAGGLAWSMPNQYVSRALVRMSWGATNESNSETPLHGGDALNGKIKQLLDDSFSRPSLASIIQRPDLDLYKNERTRKPLEDVIEQMKQKDIKIQLVSGNSAAMNFVVSFIYPDPVIAHNTVAALITKLVDTHQVAGRNAANWKTGTTLDLLDVASVPKKPTFPNRWQIAFVGLGVGVLVGLLVATFRHKPTAQWKTDSCL